MSMEIVSVRAYLLTCVLTCVYVRPPDCACANVVRINSADLAGFINQLVVFGPGKLKCPKQVIDINRNLKIDLPRLRKRQHSAPGSLSQLSPREATRWLDVFLHAGHCSVCHFAHARPTMPSISLVIICLRVTAHHIVTHNFFSRI